MYNINPEQIGSGNYGTVKKVTHKTTKQERAVKIIPKSKIKDITRFKTEVEILRTVVIIFFIIGSPQHRKAL